MARLSSPRALAALTLALAACTETPYPVVPVDMRPAAAPAPAAPAHEVLRFSVAAMQSPGDTYSDYSRFFGRMAVLLGDEIRFVQRRTYREVNDLLIAGELDAALLCTGGYLDLRAARPDAVELLAVPVIGGQTTYRSIVIVPAASPARSLEDLEGKRFAYTDELSLSGHLYVARLLGEQARTEPFFAATMFTRSHDRSIEAVARGSVDGAAVDSLVLETLLGRDPSLRERVRVVHGSPPFGVMPVVASTRLPAATRERLRAVLLSLHADPEAAAALGAVHIERFVAPPPDLYRSAEGFARRAP